MNLMNLIILTIETLTLSIEKNGGRPSRLATLYLFKKPVFLMISIYEGEIASVASASRRFPVAVSQIIISLNFLLNTPGEAIEVIGFPDHLTYFLDQYPKSFAKGCDCY